MFLPFLHQRFYFVKQCEMSTCILRAYKIFKHLSQNIKGDVVINVQKHEAHDT